jgi:hypothetical protein
VIGRRRSDALLLTPEGVAAAVIDALPLEDHCHRLELRNWHPALTGYAANCRAAQVRECAALFSTGADR